MPGNTYNILADPRSPLHHLLSKAQLLRQITEILRSYLPLTLRDHCQAANVRGRVLVVYTDSPTWTARLRYLAPELCRRVQSHPGLPTIQRVEIKTYPGLSPPRGEQPRRMQLSERSADVISAAATATPDPCLRAALQRLARRVCR